MYKIIQSIVVVNEDMLRPLNTLGLICLTRYFGEMVVYIEVLSWRDFIVVNMDMIRDVFCANNWPCWLMSAVMEVWSGGVIGGGWGGGWGIYFVC